MRSAFYAPLPLISLLHNLVCPFFRAQRFHPLSTTPPACLMPRLMSSAEEWTRPCCHGVCSDMAVTLLLLHLLQIQRQLLTSLLSASPLLCLQKNLVCLRSSILCLQSTLVLKQHNILFRVIQLKSEACFTQAGKESQIPSQHTASFNLLVPAIPTSQDTTSTPSSPCSWDTKYCLVTVIRNDSNSFHEWK